MVSTLIDRIHPFVSGWERSTGNQNLLDLIEQGQDELFDYDAPYMHFFSTDNKGFQPYLYTQANTYRYNINSTTLSATLTKTLGGTAYAVRCKRVIAVFVDTSTDYDYDRAWVGRSFTQGFLNPYTTRTERLEFAEIPCGKEPALEDTEAYIDMKEDPGTHEADAPLYFCDFIWEPPRLTSESVRLCVPKNFELALEDFVLGRIHYLQHGKWNERLERFYNGDRRRGVASWIDRFRMMLAPQAAPETYDTIPMF